MTRIKIGMKVTAYHWKELKFYIKEKKLQKLSLSLEEERYSRLRLRIFVESVLTL